MEIERLKYELEMDERMRANKKQHFIEDAKANYNEQVMKKREMEDKMLNEKIAKNSTTWPLKDEERREEYKQKLLKMNEKIEKNIDNFVDFNVNRETSRRYGNKSLYDQLRNGVKGSIIFFKFKVTMLI
jgi:uncharacterized membrane-anchored protein YjiN (DUF445 family)